MTKTVRAALGSAQRVALDAIPIAFIAFVDHERQPGITPLTGVGGLVALTLVMATAVIATRR